MAKILELFQKLNNNLGNQISELFNEGINTEDIVEARSCKISLLDREFDDDLDINSWSHMSHL